MEDSTVYSLQEIETIKQKLSAFRETLMALKMWTSTQDFQMIKNEFNELKLQMSKLEGLTEAMDGKQYTQSEVYEEQFIPFSSQLITVNQATEEINRELLSISNKLPASKNKDTSEENIVDRKGETQVNRFTSTMNNGPEINHSSSIATNQPSFMELRNLANQVSQLPHKPEIIASDEPIEDKEIEKQQRHFNGRYFQMINTYPDSIYNGLYRNTAGKTYFHFKNTKQNPHTLVHESKENHQPSDKTSEIEKVEMPVSLERVTENGHTTSLDVIASDVKNNHPSSDIRSEIEKAEISTSIESITESVNIASPGPTESTNEGGIEATASESNEIEMTMPSEEIITDSVISDVESKKQRGSFLFNLFRK